MDFRKGRTCEMESTGNANGPRKSSGFLRTTTWGTLIAASLLVTAWSFSGHFGGSNDGLGYRTSEVVAKLNPFHSTSSSKTLEPSKAPAVEPSQARSASAVAYQGHPAAEPKGPSMVAQYTPFRGVNPVAPRPSEAKGQAATETSSEAPVLIAAKMAPDLQGLDPEKPVDVIVQYRKSPATNALDENGATTKAEFPMMNAQLVTVKAGNLSDVASRSDVTYISPNRKLRGALDKVVTAVNADIAYSNGWDGTGVGVAVLDSGVGTVSDLNSDGNLSPSRIVYSQSFVPLDSSTTDAYGHGTHVSGIIAGNAYDSQNNSTYPGV